MEDLPTHSGMPQNTELPDSVRFADSSVLYRSCKSPDADIQRRAFQVLWQYLYRIVLQIARDQPDTGDFSQDYAQAALIRIYDRLDECREPAAFRTWARRIASHLVIDALRRGKRLVPLETDNPAELGSPPLPDPQPLPEALALAKVSQSELRTLINQAPISDRSRRAVLGRYLDDRPDEELADIESKLANRPVLPSHIQVTRAKNLNKLRRWPTLRAYFEAE